MPRFLKVGEKVRFLPGTILAGQIATINTLYTDDKENPGKSMKIQESTDSNAIATHAIVEVEGGFRVCGMDTFEPLMGWKDSN